MKVAASRTQTAGRRAAHKFTCRRMPAAKSPPRRQGELRYYGILTMEGTDVDAVLNINIYQGIIRRRPRYGLLCWILRLSLFCPAEKGNTAGACSHRNIGKATGGDAERLFSNGLPRRATSNQGAARYGRPSSLHLSPATRDGCRGRCTFALRTIARLRTGGVTWGEADKYSVHNTQWTVANL